MILNHISLGFGLMVKQNKTSERVTLGSEKNVMAFDTFLSHLTFFDDENMVSYGRILHWLLHCDVTCWRLC